MRHLRASAPPGVTLEVRAAKVPAGFGIATGGLAIGLSPQTLARGIPSYATGADDVGAEARYRAALNDPPRTVEGMRCAVMTTHPITDDT